MKTKIVVSNVLLALFMILTGCETEDPKDEGPSQLLEQKAFSHTKKYDAVVATSWYNLLTGITRKTPYNPPQTARIFAYTGLALYESVVPGMPSHQSVFKQFSGNAITFEKKKDYYWPACANAALARIVTKMVRDYPLQNPDLASVQQLESDLNETFKAFATDEQLAFSNEFGRYVADMIYDWSKTDGTLNPGGTLAACPPYAPLGNPGNWVPTPPGFLPAAGACQRSLRTFLPNIVDVSLPPAPPVYSADSSSDFYKMNYEIYQISLNLSDEDKLICQAWRDILGTNYNTPAHMLKLTTEIIAIENTDLENASVIYAKQGVAVFDAIASSFNAKFHYSLLRPVTFIKSQIAPNWNSLYPTPQHPSYSAVSPAAAAAAVAILEEAFGKNYSFIDNTQATLYKTWDYGSFDELLSDVGRSRTHSGLNFKISVDAGIVQGRSIGNKVNKFGFKK